MAASGGFAAAATDYAKLIELQNQQLQEQRKANDLLAKVVPQAAASPPLLAAPAPGLRRP
jgi:hypothetical protein